MNHLIQMLGQFFNCHSGIYCLTFSENVRKNSILLPELPNFDLDLVNFCDLYIAKIDLKYDSRSVEMHK